MSKNRDKLKNARVILPDNFPHWHIQYEDGTLEAITFSSPDDAEEFLAILLSDRPMPWDKHEELTCSPLEL